MTGRDNGAPFTGSRLLNQQENAKIRKLIPNDVELKAIAVAQLLQWNQSQWVAHGSVGVATFERDKARRSYFICTYDLSDQPRKTFEQELYYKFECHTNNYDNDLIIFDTETCTAGVLFSVMDEARNFSAAIHDCLEERRRRLEKRKTEQHRNYNPAGPGHPASTGATYAPQPAAHVPRVGSNPSMLPPQQQQQSVRSASKKEKGKKKPVLTKEDIGNPQNFQHVAHMGLDGSNQSALDDLPSEYQQLFQMAGIDGQLEGLQPAERQKVIKQFESNYGGRNEILNMFHQNKAGYQQVHNRPAASAAEYSSQTPPPPPPVTSGYHSRPAAPPIAPPAVPTSAPQPPRTVSNRPLPPPPGSEPRPNRGPPGAAPPPIPRNPPPAPKRNQAAPALRPPLPPQPPVGGAGVPRPPPQQPQFVPRAPMHQSNPAPPPPPVPLNGPRAPVSAPVAPPAPPIGIPSAPPLGIPGVPPAPRIGVPEAPRPPGATTSPKPQAPAQPGRAQLLSDITKFGGVGNLRKMEETADERSQRVSDNGPASTELVGGLVSALDQVLGKIRPQVADSDEEVEEDSGSEWDD